MGRRLRAVPPIPPGGARLLAADPQALIATIVELVAYAGVGDQFARLTMPCLIILGALESAHEQARGAAAALPNGAFVTVPGVGHAMAHADLIMPYVDPFIERLRPQAGARLVNAFQHRANSDEAVYASSVSELLAMTSSTDYRSVTS